MTENDQRIAIIGMGYIGLPLAIAFAEKFSVRGFDINSRRIRSLREGHDHTGEASRESIRAALNGNADKTAGLSFTDDPATLKDCNIYIIAVPTPVDTYNHPDLTMLLDATAMVGGLLNKGNIVIYESTVYPGCTEEACVPVLEKKSKLVFNRDFFCGYSPERVNPGDKQKTLAQIKKITSGSTQAIADKIDALYNTIITAGTYRAQSIKVAEAAKVVENAQRDINIAFVNELSKIFNLMDVDTHQVLDAAATKWNFIPFRPGLVGGHCIGVDPYYLARKATELGYYPEIILSGRSINDSMGEYVADAVTRLMLKKKIVVWHSTILVLGFTFKENCPDVRNTKVIDIVQKLQSYEADIVVCDPWADNDEVYQEYKLNSIRELPVNRKFDAIILAVAHNEFRHADLKAMLNEPGVLYDVKGILDPQIVDARL